MSIIFIWRRIHCLSDFHRNVGDRHEFEFIDAGYCLDRYSIEDADGNVTTVLP